MKNRRLIEIAGCVLSAAIVIALSFPRDTIAMLHQQKAVNRELSRQISELEKEKDDLSQQEKELNQQEEEAKSSLELKQTEYQDKEEELTQLQDRVLAYSDSIVQYKQNNQELLDFPYFYYDFEYAAEKSTFSRVSGAITDTLLGGTLFGSILADATKSSRVKQDTETIQQMCDFNQIASDYIESHASILNDNCIEEDIMSYSEIVCQPSKSIAENQRSIDNVEQMLGDKILEGEVRFSESENLEELIPIYAAANLIASAYYDVYGGDSEAFDMWSTFAGNCNWKLWSGYTDDEMREIVKESYRDELQPLYDAYCDLVGGRCVFGYQQSDTISVFVMGEGNHRIEYYYRENENGERGVVAVKVMDEYSEPKVSIYYDIYNCVSAVVDNLNGRKYYYYDAVPMDPSMENVEAVTEFADWMYINCYDNVTKIDQKEYARMFECFR